MVGQFWFPKIVVGRPVVRDPPSEVNLFQVSLTEGFTYQIEAKPLDDRSLEPSSLVYKATSDPDFGMTIRGDPVPFTSGTAFTAPETRDYIIEVLRHDSSDVGSYILEVGSYDYAAGPETTGRVLIGDSALGVIETVGDRDWFGVQLIGGQTYRIDMMQTDSVQEGLPDPVIGGVFDGQGRLVLDTSGSLDVDDGGDGLNSRLFFTPAVSGEYFIDTRGFQTSTGSYRLAVDGPDDYADNAGTTGVLDDWGSVRGGIQSAGDVDWFRAALQAGETYSIRLMGAETGNGTLADPFLSGIYDSSGTQISKLFNNDGGSGRNAFLAFVPERSGDYFIAAAANGVDTGTYELMVEPDILW